ncbi:MAG: bifunctional 5,10-methylenetetrahydrofolate dehydrogenase/5,10-methenyltetrahydrofolate cyclohydrolase [bacterium]|nr:bifunctional 5,10-methylenetetrahydrofolate dehydrogenase/5,10-methenyltetrahydrofolate cyclohydrolase [bacterium]
MIIDGKQIASLVLAELKKQPQPTKKMIAVLVGDDPASLSFLKQKERVAKELGVGFELKQFSGDIGQVELMENIVLISSEQNVGGLIVQLPLPARFDRDQILSAITLEKDVDVLVGSILPPAVLAVEDILNFLNFDLKGKIVGVVGKGFLVGAPIAKWLQGKCSQVIIFDSKSDLADLKKADLVITGTGKAGLITDDMLKEGAGVIDFGYGMVNGKISGDFAASLLLTTSPNLLAFYTPTPGGTGPILVAELYKNFYSLNS